MKEIENTSELVSTLSTFGNKNDFIAKIESELDRVINELSHMGFNIDKHKGFIGVQVLKNSIELFTYQYFRDLHFLYWGFRDNWDTIDDIDKLYYEGLKNLVEKLYNSLP